MRYELVQRGIEQTDGDSISVHGFEDTLEVATLHREQQLCESLTASFDIARKDHFAHSLDAVAFEEHMLRTAQTDALSAEVACLLGIAGRVGVGAHESLGIFSREIHDSAEVTVEFGIGGGHLTVIDVTGRSVERDPVALGIGLAAHFHSFAL